MSPLKELANAVRILSVDGVDKAQSGHPGMPLGMADIATVLWKKFLKFNPENPHWFNRDRFVLSNGHGSMLLYSLLHLTGYKLSLDDLKQFRQLHSKTPGHPENDHTPGVETTTGPLGQGLANGVGMAIAEALLAATFNRKDIRLVDHYTYVFVGDGCLMEGISHEVCSLAGTLGLGKLIVFYDDNGISIDGKVESWFTDDTPARFRAYHWQVIDPIDGHDERAIEEAILMAKANTTKPTLIPCKTIIGLGASVAGSEKAHGAPLSALDVDRVRAFFNWGHKAFDIPEDIYQRWNHKQEGQMAEDEWLFTLNQYKESYKSDYFEFLRRINGDLPEDWQEKTSAFFTECQKNDKAMATRRASQLCIDYFAQCLPEMFGGSADLTSSNNTDWSKSSAIGAQDFSGNYLYYGVREFGMAAIMNGLAVHGGFIPYGGTFLVFSDYARNAIRLSALMGQRVIYVFTHDSIGLGEDGPTHQPVEQASSLRMMPGLQVWRPASLMETAVAWREALEHHRGPSALLLSRQNLPTIKHAPNAAEQIKRGGYVIMDSSENPEFILIATGSELHLAMEAALEMEQEGHHARVVSMPSAERFLEQDCAYQNQVLPKQVRKRIAIEAASSAYWYQFVGLDGVVIGLDRFGVSAPGMAALDYLGFTKEHIMTIIKSMKSENENDNKSCD